MLGRNILLHRDERRTTGPVQAADPPPAPPVRPADAPPETRPARCTAETLQMFTAVETGLRELGKAEKMLRSDICWTVAACLSSLIPDPSKEDGLSQRLSVAHQEDNRAGVSASELLRNLRKMLVGTDVRFGQAPDFGSANIGPRPAAILGDLLGSLLRAGGAFAPVREHAASKALSTAIADHYWHTFGFSERQVTHDIITAKSRPGVAHAVRNAMARAYSSDGFHLFATSPPVIYIAQGSGSESIRETLSEMLILGMAELVSVRELPCRPDSEIMSLIDLKEACDEDIAGGRTPLMVIGRAGTPVTGQVDDVNGLRLISDLYKMWLHLEGDAVCLIDERKKDAIAALSAIGLADSISFDTWHLTGIPLLRHLCTTTVRIEPIVPPIRIPHWTTTLPLWFALQALGKTGPADRAEKCVAEVTSFKEQIAGVPGIFIHERHDGTPHVVMFRYSMLGMEAELGEDDERPLDQNDRVAAENRITRHLARLATSRGWPLELAMLDWRAYIRFSPWMSGHVPSMDLGTVVETFRREAELVRSNVTLQPKFRRTMQAKGLLVVEGKEIDGELIGHVETDHGDAGRAFGLGCLRYVPSYISLEHVGGVQEDLDALNVSLVDFLREEHDACLFSRGVTTEGRACVFIGVDRSRMTEENIGILADVISVSATHVESSSRFMSRMADVIRRGISEAERVLQSSSDRAMHEDGIVRHIPLVGSVYNWLSPRPPSSRELKGKSFCISTGCLSDPPSVLSPTSKLPNQEMGVPAVTVRPG